MIEKHGYNTQSWNIFCFHFLIYGKKIHQKVHRAEKILAIQFFIVNFFFPFLWYTVWQKTFARVWQNYMLLSYNFFLYMSLSDKLFCQLRQFGLVLIFTVFGSFVCLVTVICRFFQCSEVSLNIIKILTDSNFTKLIRALW